MGRANDTLLCRDAPKIEGNISCFVRRKKNGIPSLDLVQACLNSVGLNGKIVGNKLRFEHRSDV